VVVYDCLSLPQNTIVVTSQKPDDEINVSTDPFAIVVSYGEIANINYTLLTAGNVSLSIYKPTDILIKKLLENQAQAAGTYKLTWDGTDSSGKPVSEAADYIVKIELVVGGKTIARSGNISVDFIKR
jgi:flagellar hook assembly protein FlgD